MGIGKGEEPGQVGQTCPGFYFGGGSLPRVVMVF